MDGKGEACHPAATHSKTMSAYRSWKIWKVVEFYILAFLRPGKSWNLLRS